MDAAVDFALEEPGGFQHAEVLGNRGQGHGEGFGQLRDHGLAARQAGQDGTAGGIGQRAKGGVEERGGIVNHMV
jgi:hypothetical protein